MRRLKFWLIFFGLLLVFAAAGIFGVLCAVRPDIAEKIWFFGILPSILIAVAVVMAKDMMDD